MKVKFLSWSVRGINQISSRNLVKSSLLKWKADGYCLQETKVSKNVMGVAKQLWAGRWMRCGYVEADRSNGEFYSGGIADFGWEIVWRWAISPSPINLKLFKNLFAGFSLACMPHTLEGRNWSVGRK